MEGLSGLEKLTECELDFASSTVSNVKALGPGLSGLKQLQKLKEPANQTTKMKIKS